MTSSTPSLVEYRYRALLLGFNRFSGALDLKSSAANVELMKKTLTDPLWGVCDPGDVAVVLDDDVIDGRDTKRVIEDFIVKAAPNEVLVLYFSGHGIVRGAGGTNLALSNSAEVVTGHELSGWMQQCRARLVYLIVDACFAGLIDLEKLPRHRTFVIGASDDRAAPDSDVVGQPSEFTARLVEFINKGAEQKYADLIAAVQPGGDPFTAYEPTVIAATNTDPSSIPLRRAEPRIIPAAPSRRGAPAGSRGGGRGGFGSLVVGVIVVIFLLRACFGGETKRTDQGSAPAGPSAGTAAAVIVVGAATTAAPIIVGVPERSTPLESVAAADLGFPDRPITDPLCDGSWITQIASVNADKPGARESVVAELALPGTTYTYAPASCSVFDQEQNWYVIYIGTFGTREQAQAICDGSGDGDCFPRQLNP